MCRLLAYLGPPVTLDALLLDPPHSLLHQSWAPRLQRHGTVNADGFGAGWYDLDRRPEPARYRRAQPMWTDRSFASLAGLVSTTAVVAAVRGATPPLPVEETSTPPFTWGPWLFAHNGAVLDFKDGAGARLRARLSPGRDLEGGSDSEVLFALALDHLDRGASLGDALRGTVGIATAEASGRFNCVLGDGRSLAATACGDSLFVRTGTGAGAGAATVIASEPYDDDPAWQAVPEGSVVEATATDLTIRPL